MRDKAKFDVIIVGGGPAGMSASLWCAELGLSSLAIEREDRFGGQLSHIFNPVDNYLGLSASNGDSIREEFERSLIGRKFTRMVGVEVTDLDPERMAVTVADGNEYSACALILSTGVRRRRLNVPGETEFEGKGILSSGSRDPASVAGQRVVVVGGGDAAAENALILAQYARRVTLVHRRGKLTARSEFLKRLDLVQNIDLSFDSVVENIRGTDRLAAVEIRNVATGEIRTMETDFLVVRIGVQPNSELVKGKIELDGRGYALVDSQCRTKVPGIYAIGDVANPASPTIATAAGMGATAAKSAYALLSTSKWL